MIKNFDPTKPCRTRDGRSVRILCTDLAGNYPIAAVVGAKNQEVRTYTTGGYFIGDDEPHHRDLVNVPEKNFDPTKPCQSRNGCPVRIICTDRDGPYPIVALCGDAQAVRAFTADGFYLKGDRTSQWDLVNAFEEGEGL